jgi:ABC-type sugar transport system ATPase subunit
MATDIRIEELKKNFEHVTAVSDVNLHVNEREFLVLLGPSGCGKTTTLRCVAGVETPDRGEISFNGKYVFSESRGIDVEPKRRNVGLVFQNYALYPHMTVFDNVAFGMRIRGFLKRDITRRVKDVLEMVEMSGFEERYPASLSGGQRQRIAVARMIVRKPGILLYDEPLSNLDPKLRGSLRTHLRNLHDKLAATSIYVTHDQEEAMILADRIAVMLHGQIVQIASADTLYRYPATGAVASFTGNPRTNLITGMIENGPYGPVMIPREDTSLRLLLPGDFRPFTGQTVTLHARPEDIELDLSTANRDGLAEPEDPFTNADVFAVMPQGADVLVSLRFGRVKTEILVRGTDSRYWTIRPRSVIGFRLIGGNIYSAETGLLIGSFGSRNIKQRRIYLS